MLRFKDFKMAQRRVIQREEIRALIKRKAGEVFDVAPKILHEVMQRATRCADGGGAILQPEAVERRDLEMFADGEDGGLRRERPVIIGADGPAGVAEQIAERGGFHRMHDLGGAEAFEFGEERGLGFDFRGEEIAGGQIHEREAEVFPGGTNGGEKVVFLRDEHSFIEVRAGRENLGDLAIDEFAGLGFLGLLADGDLASGSKQATDVRVRRVMRQAAHRNAIARGEGEIDQLRASLRVLEEHFVEVAEAEEQERVLGQFAFDAAILGHHGSELRFVRHAAGKLMSNDANVEGKFSRWRNQKNTCNATCL